MSSVLAKNRPGLVGARAAIGADLAGHLLALAPGLEQRQLVGQHEHLDVAGLEVVGDPLEPRVGADRQVGQPLHRVERRAAAQAVA